MGGRKPETPSNTQTSHRADQKNILCCQQWLHSEKNTTARGKEGFGRYVNTYTTSSLLIDYLVYFFLLLLTNCSLLHVLFPNLYVYKNTVLG